MIAAQQYYIDFGPEMAPERLQTLVPACIPDSALHAKSMSYWAQNITASFRKGYYVRERVPPNRLKEEIVNYAKYKWPLLFSRFYEVRTPLLHLFCDIRKNLADGA